MVNGLRAPEEAFKALVNRDWKSEPINPHELRWTFAGCPLWLLQQSEVTPGAKMLYARLLLFAGKNGAAYANQATLARELGTSSRQIRRWLQELEKVHKLIDGKKRSYGDVNGYTFLSHPWQEMGLRNLGMSAQRRPKSEASS